MHDALKDLKAQAERGGVFLDFDGTLSEIVDVPGDARPVRGAAELLQRLARRFAIVAVVSGRSAQQLVDWLGPAIEVWGTHGAERAEGGRIEFAPDVRHHLDTMREARTEATRRLEELGLEGIELEDKRIMIALHYRRSPDRAAARDAILDLARALSEERGLLIGEGRLVIELRPPVALSKARVLLQRAEEAGLRAVAFVGDDAVDLPAFDALDRLEERGLITVRVAVSSDEAPEALLARADVVVEGPAGVLELLRGLT
jgi:trehalose 6-phosphate phosphatase